MNVLLCLLYIGYPRYIILSEASLTFTLTFYRIRKTSLTKGSKFLKIIQVYKLYAGIYLFNVFSLFFSKLVRFVKKYKINHFLSKKYIFLYLFLLKYLFLFFIKKDTNI